MGASLALAGLVVGLVLGGGGVWWSLRWFLGGNREYGDPQLHSGLFAIQHLGDTTVWTAVLAPTAVPDVSPGHIHRVRECTIGPNLAHVDQCFCGAERYGVFGAWS